MAPTPQPADLCTLFVKKLPRGATEADVAEAFGQDNVVAVKMLKNRRAIVDVRKPPEAELEQGCVLVAGLSCPLILPDDGGILPGGASQPDARASVVHSCTVCGATFPTERRLRAHLADGTSHRKPPPVWRPDRLDEFGKITSNLMVGRMSSSGRAALNDYLGHAAPQWPELSTIIGWLAVQYPTSLRLKELLETLECFRVVGQFIYERQAEVGALSGIFDLACGHGLLGVLLAYRFPDVAVTLVDLEPRASLGHYREAWAAEGQPAPGRTSLDNLRFICGDVADVDLPARSVACCVHACNEANLIVMRKCRKAGAFYGMMPCCVPEQIYSRVDCRHVPDEARYPLMVGIMAAKFNAAKLRAIDGRITNRNLIVCGGEGEPQAGPDGDDEIVLRRTHRRHPT